MIDFVDSRTLVTTYSAYIVWDAVNKKWNAISTEQNVKSNTTGSYFPIDEVSSWDGGMTGTIMGPATLLETTPGTFRIVGDSAYFKDGYGIWRKITSSSY
jgi:hypothetical protein